MRTELNLVYLKLINAHKTKVLLPATVPILLASYKITHPGGWGKNETENAIKIVQSKSRQCGTAAFFMRRTNTGL